MRHCIQCDTPITDQREADKTAQDERCADCGHRSALRGLTSAALQFNLAVERLRKFEQRKVRPKLYKDLEGP